MPSQTKAFLGYLVDSNASSTSRKDSEGFRGCVGTPQTQRDFSETHHEGTLTDDIVHSRCTLGTNSLQRTSVLPTFLLGQEEKVPGQQRGPPRGGKKFVKMVAQHGQVGEGSTLGAVEPIQGDYQPQFLETGAIWRE